jgi:mRNA-degrading endonuclease toxin of MazEF toxin-antitoxin module
VPISPPEGGVTDAGVIMCDQIRTVSVDDRLGQYWGSVAPGTMATVEDRVKIHLGLKSK